MHPYYFDIDQARTRRAAVVLAFERTARGGWPPRPPRRRWRDAIDTAATRLRLWRRRYREREQLARLDARGLRDIGVTPYEAAIECNKPFWRE